MTKHGRARNRTGWILGLSLCLALGPYAFTEYATAGSSPPSPPYAIALAVGDFDADGYLDLATTIRDSNLVAVALGRGDGFEPPNIFPVENRPSAVAVGDFNGDGKLDLAVTNYASNTVSVLLGQGDGTTFTAVVPSLTTGMGPNSVAAGDLNGDGNVDLVVATALSRQVTIYSGRGDGSFEFSRLIVDASGPYAVALGDLDGDGILDLVLTDANSNTLSSFLGLRDGSFQLVDSYRVGTFPVSVALGDLDEDGQLDLVIANLGSNSLSTFIGNGDGTFNAQPDRPVDSPVSVALGDLRGNGHLTLLVGTLSGIILIEDRSAQIGNN